VDVDATLLSIQDDEWQRGRLMTLGIPLKVPSVELEFFIGRIVHEQDPGGRKRETGFRFRKSAISLSLWHSRRNESPPVQTQSNFINHAADEEMADKITWLIRRFLGDP